MSDVIDGFLSVKGGHGLIGDYPELIVPPIDQMLTALENKKNLTVDDLVKDQNFITMKQDGIIKALMGLTTMEEILRTVNA